MTLLLRDTLGDGEELIVVELPADTATHPHRSVSSAELGTVTGTAHTVACFYLSDGRTSVPCAAWLIDVTRLLREVPPLPELLPKSVAHGILALQSVRN